MLIVTKSITSASLIPSLRIITYWTEIILAFAEHDEIQKPGQISRSRNDISARRGYRPKGPEKGRRGKRCISGFLLFFPPSLSSKVYIQEGLCDRMQTLDCFCVFVFLLSSFDGAAGGLV